ncbi:Nudix hydrolase domain-containing protein [Mycena kentingensis (nom. inval.)]|nr:Nudix hydrolase domain-containing protein [Mycena kentingensis (nom. inval.)]
MVNIQHYPLREYPNGTTCLPGEYLSFWYVGSIAADAVPEENTRMEDEINYQTHLLTYDEAKKCLFPDQVHVLKYAKVLLEHTRKVQAHRRQISEPVSTTDVSANSAATAGGKPKYPSIPGYHDPKAELYSHNAFGDVYLGGNEIDSFVVIYSEDYQHFEPSRGRSMSSFNVVLVHLPRFNTLASAPTPPRAVLIAKLPRG